MSALAIISPGVLGDACAATFLPRPRISVAEWADRNRVVSRPSPEAGRWRTDRVPYMREIMESISDPAVERVVVQAASQVGKSELILNIVGFYIEQDPSSILVVQPDEKAMAAFSKERVKPMLRDTPALQGKVSEAQRSSDNTIMGMEFPGGRLSCAWAGSASSLASRAIRVLLGDELDKWPDTTGKDGDPWAQAKQRTSNFPNRKIIAVSTPTVDEMSPIAKLYSETDQRRYHAPCPRCGVAQVLEWGNVIYKDEAGAEDLDGIHYQCPHCMGRIEEHERPAMLAEGQWIAEDPSSAIRGYQISALYSPWVRWAELASEWIKANKDRDKRGLQEFINLRLGEPWIDGGVAVNAEHLESNREEYGCEVPDGVVLLTAGGDVQGDRLEVEVCGWGAGRESWAIEYAVLLGDPTTDAPWRALDAFRSRTWRRADGSILGIHRMFIDSNYLTSRVYAYCKPREWKVCAIRGRGDTTGVPMINSKPSTIGQQDAHIFWIGDGESKDILHSRLLLKTHGPGYCHFPAEPDRGYDTAYFKGLCSERPRVKTRAGKREREWVKVRVRNEPWDVRRYAMAAMEVSCKLDGVNLDKPASRTPQEPTPPTAPAAPMVRKPVKRGWRVLSAGTGWGE